MSTDGKAAAPAATVTPDQVLETLGRVRTGRVFDLSVSIATGTPRLPGQTPFVLSMAMTPRDMRRTLAAMGIESDAGFVIERVEMDLHTGTHIDALGHVAIGDAMYGGASVGDIVYSSGVAKLGAEEIPSFVSRGILLDIAKVAGVESLPLGHTVSADEVRAALLAAGVTLQRGDVVLIHTGWLAANFADPTKYAQPGYPGLGLEAADLLIEGGALVIGADNISVEPMLSQAPPDFACVHKRCIAQAGVFLMENVRTEELVRAGITEFAFIGASVKILGGTGGLTRPLAIV